MWNAAVNVSLVTLMFVWDRTIGSWVPLSVLDRLLSSSAQREVVL